MLFNSYIFLLVFLPLVLLGWWVVLRTPMQRTIFLAASSFTFYAYHDFPMGAKLLPLLALAIVVGYYSGVRMTRSTDEAARRRWLAATLVFNVAMLCFFKYLGFFAGTMEWFAGIAGRHVSVDVWDVVFPIGISFYTFTSMSYSVDVYRRSSPPARSLLEYATFMTFFPHLVMGPIVRFSEMGPQLQSLPKRLTGAMATAGIFLLTCGLCKKLVLADSIAPTVDRLFAASDQLTIVSSWAAAVGYTLQLYFDFSGYSDMAVGIALLLGFRFPQNFNSPYKATSMSQFWGRWHMTLSRWLRDYVYFPLGGSRSGRLKTLRNVVIVMFIGGLWHGGNWTFVVWGLAHGALLVIENVAKQRGWSPANAWVRRALMMFWVTYLRVIFRASTLAVGFSMMGAMFGTNGIGLGQLEWTGSAGATVTVPFLLLLAAMLVFVNVAPNSWEVRLQPTRWRSYAVGAAAATAVLLLATPAPFIYLQF
ncbi:MAG: Peptidoglycan O-acetyltransferase [Thermoleophilia bacterium]|nr:Peptidoglycan O-acetyltransferase [Thermoleophilia bacterium]